MNNRRKPTGTGRKKTAGSIPRTSARTAGQPSKPAGAPSYQILFNSSPEPMWIFDLDTLRFLDVNEAALRKYGYSLTEFRRMTLKDIRPPEDVPKLLDSLHKTRLHGLDAVGRWRHSLKSGRVIEVDVMAHPIRFNGKDAILAMLRDVSENRKLEEELKGTQQHLRAIIANAPIFLFAVDTKGIFTLSEGRGLEALNLRPGQIVGCSIFDLYR